MKMRYAQWRNAPIGYAHADTNGRHARAPVQGFSANTAIHAANVMLVYTGFVDQTFPPDSGMRAGTPR